MLRYSDTDGKWIRKESTKPPGQKHAGKQASRASEDCEWGNGAPPTMTDGVGKNSPGKHASAKGPRVQNREDRRKTSETWPASVKKPLRWV